MTNTPIDRESVERFDPQLDKNGRPVLVGHHKSDGFWVKYDDFCAALDAAEAENKRLKEALDAIQQYGGDTLSGRVDGPDNRAWQREGVLEMTRRARAALQENPDG